MLKNSKGEQFIIGVKDIDIDENGVNDFDEYGEDWVKDKLFEMFFNLESAKKIRSV